MLKHDERVFEKMSERSDLYRNGMTAPLQCGPYFYIVADGKDDGAMRGAPALAAHVKPECH